MRTEKARTAGEIVRGFSLFGSASLVSAALGLVRMKLAALILGPAGLGVIGLLQNTAGVATILGDMGMRQSGTREIARARAANDEAAIRAVSATLMWLGIAIASLAGVIFFVLRDEIARKILSQPTLSPEIGWLSLGVAATIMSAAITGILNGHRLVGDLNKITVLSALASCLISVIALLQRPSDAIIVMILSSPITLLIYSLWYGRKNDLLPRLNRPTRETREVATRILKLGVFVMLSAFLLSVSEFGVRIIIGRGLGENAAGFFTAAWTLGVYYLNFLMVATASDFYPRISSNIKDPKFCASALDTQVYSLAIFSAPITITLVSFCPIVISLLFSEKFVVAKDLIRLMVVGDILRLAIYPSGFVLLASARGKTFLGLKSVEAIVFLSLVLLLLPSHGLIGIGFAHIVTFIILFLIYNAVTFKALGSRPAIRSILAVCSIFLITGSLGLLATQSEVGATVMGICIITMWMVLARRLLGLRTQTPTQ